MTTGNHQVSNYILKVPSSFTKRLTKILKTSPQVLKFEELNAKVVKKYNCRLYVLATTDNELILETDYISDERHKLKNETDIICSEEEIKGLQNCIKNVDLTDEYNKVIRNLSSSSSGQGSGSYTRNYVEIKLTQVLDTRSGNYYISNFFDVWHWRVNDVLIAFIGNIYDPSKLWIRFAPVDTFQKLLWEFYVENGKNLLMSSSDISIGKNCVVLISNLYYRSKIVRTDIQDNKVYKVFLYDFGIVAKVQYNQIYNLHNNFNQEPAFAVRCMLTNISPLDNEMWSQNAVDRFLELVKDKQLVVQIAHIHAHRKILEIDLFDINLCKEKRIISINYLLVCEKMAKIAWHPPEVKENDQFKRLKKYLYHYPTFEMIENGITPSQAYLTEQLKSCVAWDVVFPELYRYELNS